MAEPIFDDSTPNDELFPKHKGRGLVPRDYNIDPPEMFAPPTDLQLIPQSEWSDRIKEQEAAKSRISDILLAAGIPSLDQGPNGYCWGHSTVGCVQAVRAINNAPYVPLSACRLRHDQEGRERGRVVRPVGKVSPRAGRSVSGHLAAGQPELPGVRQARNMGQRGATQGHRGLD